MSIREIALRNKRAAEARDADSPWWASAIETDEGAEPGAEWEADETAVRLGEMARAFYGPDDEDDDAVAARPTKKEKGNG